MIVILHIFNLSILACPSPASFNSSKYSKYYKCKEAKGPYNLVHIPKCEIETPSGNSTEQPYFMKLRPVLISVCCKLLTVWKFHC